ncbi:desumoylating isopeptidase [Pycnococcus provasolii]|mmetsp:Transcript_12153/g.27616  ORF Transcript_12153/g.27616 Transcript_12153/m.27616 type:complete len:329 (-) Transcript_12153:25-1011(-)
MDSDDMDGGAPVTLHVYELSGGLAAQMSHILLGKTITGIWHTGVCVYGREYFFGGGICDGAPGMTPFGPPHERVTIGTTHVPRAMFEELLAELSARFHAATYSLMHNNCNHFSEEVCQFLVGRGIPSHILQLPQEVLSSPAGAMLAPLLEGFEAQMRGVTSESAAVTYGGGYGGNNGVGVGVGVGGLASALAPAADSASAGSAPATPLPTIGGARGGERPSLDMRPPPSPFPTDLLTNMMARTATEEPPTPVTPAGGGFAAMNGDGGGRVPIAPPAAPAKPPGDSNASGGGGSGGGGGGGGVGDVGGGGTSSGATADASAPPGARRAL